MNVSKSDVVNLLVSLGFENATKWDINKLNKKLKRLPAVIESLNEDQLSITEQQTELLTEILDCAIGEEPIIIDEADLVVIETSADPVIETAETAETVEESKDDPEVETGLKTEPEPETEAKPKRQKLPSLITEILKKQTGEFKARNIIALVGDETGNAESSINVHVNMALIYGVAFGTLEKVSHGTYKIK